MNLVAAYCRRPPPHTAMRKYIGTRTTSKNTKKTSRSSATNVPSMPTSSSSIIDTNAAGRPGSGSDLRL